MSKEKRMLCLHWCCWCTHVKDLCVISLTHTYEWVGRPGIDADAEWCYFYESYAAFLSVNETDFGFWLLHEACINRI